MSPAGSATIVAETAPSFSCSLELAKAPASTVVFVTVPPTETCSVSSRGGSSSALSFSSGFLRVVVVGIFAEAALPPVMNTARMRRSLSGSACNTSAIWIVSPGISPLLLVVAFGVVFFGSVSSYCFRSSLQGFPSLNMEKLAVAAQNASTWRKLS
ncbi:hypothetical protein M569_03960 [Genlisea aurea]|uniref:Uncharacterized protein n=1 Tax=Genlisea aurea TaxID=192259 RepID=S8CTZ6_9LAMI|nr:hypothetical protein M569_03960 [Genlisea aurea]